MAENKNSFLLYSDLLHTIEKLPDDKAGAVFKHILKYVNDLNPKTDDLIVNVVFEPIRQQLKRDLKKWEGTKEQKSQAGLSSAFNKAKKKFDEAKKDDIPKLISKYKEVLKKEPDNKYLLKCIEYLNTLQQKSTPLNTVKQKSTESTVSVSDTVNVNDSVITLKSTSLLSEIKISDVAEDLKFYFDWAVKFQQLFIKNQKANFGTTHNQEKATFKNYVTHIKRLFDIDKVSKEQVQSVYDYLDSDRCVRGDFSWKTNILSTSKLREKFERLSSEAGSIKKKQQPTTYKGNR